MQCQTCGKQEATVHVIEVDGAGTKETHVCKACAAAQRLVPEPGGPAPLGIACPKCGGERMAQVKGRGRRLRWRCEACGQEFVIAVAPGRARGERRRGK